MNKESVSVTFVLIILILTSTVSAQVYVGVKQGDWMEYDITYTGSPPEKRETWIRIEVLNVQGAIIDIRGIIRYLNGTQETITKILDLDAGKLGDVFIIPTRLGENDQFFDETEGYVTLDGTEPDLQFPDFHRTVVYIWSPEFEDY